MAAISVIFGSQLSKWLLYSVRGMKYSILHNTAVTKQWTTKWPCIANAGFQIVKSRCFNLIFYFRRF